MQNDHQVNEEGKKIKIKIKTPHITLNKAVRMWNTYACMRTRLGELGWANGFSHQFVLIKNNFDMCASSFFFFALSLCFCFVCHTHLIAVQTSCFWIWLLFFLFSLFNSGFPFFYSFLLFSFFSVLFELHWLKK